MTLDLDFSFDGAPIETKKKIKWFNFAYGTIRHECFFFRFSEM